MVTLIRTCAQGQGIDDWARNIHEMIEEMHRRTYIPFRDCGTWQPATNVYEDEAAYHVCFNKEQTSPNDILRAVLESGARIAGPQRSRDGDRRRPVPARD